MTLLLILIFLVAHANEVQHETKASSNTTELQSKNKRSELRVRPTKQGAWVGVVEENFCLHFSLPKEASALKAVEKECGQREHRWYPQNESNFAAALTLEQLLRRQGRSLCIALLPLRPSHSEARSSSQLKKSLNEKLARNVNKDNSESKRPAGSSRKASQLTKILKLPQCALHPEILWLGAENREPSKNSAHLVFWYRGVLLLGAATWRQEANWAMQIPPTHLVVFTGGFNSHLAGHRLLQSLAPFRPLFLFSQLPAQTAPPLSVTKRLRRYRIPWVLVSEWRDWAQMLPPLEKH